VTTHFILTPIGSAGDVHPYVGLGRALRARGHRVTVLAAEPFGDLVERAGLEFGWHWSTADYDRAAAHPDLWHPRRSLRYILGLVTATTPRLYQLIESRHEAGRTVLVGHVISFATRVFEERHGVPAATLVLAPSALRSEFAQPVVPGGVDLTFLPRPAKRALWWAVDRFAIDPHVVPALNAWRVRLDLGPVGRVFREWVLSPRRAIGLFPPWFAPPQPDWPAQLRLTGFPRFDESGLRPADPALEAFLAAGPPPIVASPGSANRQAHRFFAAVLDAAARLGRRALLLTPERGQVLAVLPAWAHWAPYAPFSAVLPRAAAFVHHGGIGSVAQGLAAATPQLAVPMSHDQPDNAARMTRLGVGASLPASRLTGAGAAGALARLLESPAVARAAALRAEATRAGDPVGETCDLLEELLPAAGGRR
jgi:UDP:flavonoid glycosyltransferase YjiC (YdhE family)